MCRVRWWHVLGGGIMHLIHIHVECETCGKVWESKNAHGVGARHAKLTGHTVFVEKCYAHIYNNETRLDAIERLGPIVKKARSN